MNDQPTPEEIEFIEGHRPQIQLIMKNENAWRTSQNLTLLTTPEVKAITVDLMQHIAGGGTIDKFAVDRSKFKPDRLEVPALVQPKAQKKFTFVIKECSNGFILYIDNQEHIFKKMAELSRILATTLNLTGEKENGNGNNDVAKVSGRPKKSKKQNANGNAGADEKSDKRDHSIKESGGDKAQLT